MSVLPNDRFSITNLPANFMLKNYYHVICYCSLRFKTLMEEIMRQNLRVVSFIILSLMLLPFNASAQLVKGGKSSTNSGSNGTKTTNTGGIRGLGHLRTSEDLSYRNSHRR